MTEFKDFVNNNYILDKEIIGMKIWVRKN